MTGLRLDIERLLRRLDKSRQAIESGDEEFRQAVNALEARLGELFAVSPTSPDGLESLIEASDLPLADKRWLHGIRRVRNVLIHNADVYVGKPYARIALERFRRIALI